MPASSNTTPELDLFQRLEMPMTVETAESILQWRFSDSEVDRMNELAAKAREGSLSEAEEAAVDSYERLNNLLGILKSRARQTLKAQTSDSA